MVEMSDEQVDRMPAVGPEERVVVAGGPRTGKSTFAETLRKASGAQILHTDDLIHLGWSEASQEAATWIVKRPPRPWILEGVAAARALRKVLGATDDLQPCDVVYVLDVPVVARTKGQVSMAKGCVKVFTEIEPELLARGVTVHHVGDVRQLKD